MIRPAKAGMGPVKACIVQMAIECAGGSQWRLKRIVNSDWAIEGQCCLSGLVELSRLTMSEGPIEVEQGQ